MWQCETRWNSNVILLESVLGEYAEIFMHLETQKEEQWLPGPESLLADLVNFLKPLMTARRAQFFQRSHPPLDPLSLHDDQDALWGTGFGVLND